MVVVLYVFYFQNIGNDDRSRQKNIVVRLCSVDENVDIDNPPNEIDGVLLTVDDIVLLKDQLDSSQNGIYSVVQHPKIYTNYRFVHDKSIGEGSQVFVRYGVQNHGRSFRVLREQAYSGRVTSEDYLGGVTVQQLSFS